MSAPNSSFDPVQVAALDAENLAKVSAAGLAAITAALDLAQLAEVKLAHLGDRSPIAGARRELGALPPQAKADAGKRVNEVLKELQAAFAEQLEVLERKRDELVLVEERVDVTLPVTRPIPGARHPITTL